MSVSRVSILAVVVLGLAAALFFKQQFLSASDRDLMRHIYGLQADQFHNPVPGKAYAFNTNDKRFDPSGFCSLGELEDAEGNRPLRLKGVNLAGRSYNAALEGAGGFIGDRILNVIRAKNAEKIWKLDARYRDGNGASFDVDCLQNVDTQVMFGRAIYIVDTVYYRSGDMNPYLVVFKNGPVTINCQNDCPQPVSVVSLIPADRITRVKWDWGIIHFQNPPSTS